MIDITRGLAAVVAALAAALVWLSPGATPPAAAEAAQEPVEEILDERFDRCTFRLLNRYSPEDGTQYAFTRQVWEEDVCTFGGRNRSIRVRVCFRDSEDHTPVDCSGWLMPTSEEPYAESEVTTTTPRSSIHYVEIHGERRTFTLAAPEVPPAPPATPAAGPTTSAAPPTTAPTTTPPATEEPSPPAGGSAQLGSGEPERTEAPPPRPDRTGLVAGLATGGVVLLGLGGAGIWLLRRNRYGTG